MNLLKEVETNDEPIVVAVEQGFHWVLVLGYSANYDLNLPNSPDPGTSYSVIYFDPQDPQGQNIHEVDGYYWENTEFLAYQSNANNQYNSLSIPADPDPSNGIYTSYLTPVPTKATNHWIGKWVDIERDDNFSYSPDYAFNGDTGQVISPNVVSITVSSSQHMNPKGR